MRTVLFILVMIVAVMVLFAATAPAAKRAYEVACYSGTTHSFLRSIPNVFDPTRAAGLCNTVFSECDNNCTGCYMNIDNKQVCYTSSGQVFSD